MKEFVGGHLPFDTDCKSDRRVVYKAKERVGFKGVFKCGRKFKSQIQIDKVRHYLGLFDTEVEAAKAYDDYAKKFLGPKAKLNLDSSMTTLPKLCLEENNRNFSHKLNGPPISAFHYGVDGSRMLMYAGNPYFPQQAFQGQQGIRFPFYPQHFIPPSQMQYGGISVAPVLLGAQVESADQPPVVPHSHPSSTPASPAQPTGSADPGDQDRQLSTAHDPTQQPSQRSDQRTYSQTPQEAPHAYLPMNWQQHHPLYQPQQHPFAPSPIVVQIVPGPGATMPYPYALHGPSGPPPYMMNYPGLPPGVVFIPQQAYAQPPPQQRQQVQQQQQQQATTQARAEICVGNEPSPSEPSSPGRPTAPPAATVAVVPSS